MAHEPSGGFGILMMNELLRRFPVKSHEWRALLAALVSVLLLFLAYYVLRPIRDEIGATDGVRQLPWLFSATLGAMLLLNPVYGYLVKRFSRERFIAITYRFFMANLAIFAWLMTLGHEMLALWTGRVFFVWLSVFNLFVVSVFWSLAVDVFSREQSRRLFGYLASGATVGGLLGAAWMSAFGANIQRAYLFLLAMILLEMAVWSMRDLARSSSQPHHQNPAKNSEMLPENTPIGGSVWAGLSSTLRSPYLLAIAAYMVLYAMSSTVLYFQQVDIVNAHYSDRATRTAFFAQIDLWVNALTLICQLFLTGQLARKWGVMAVLLILPLVSSVGFASLAIAPTIAVFVCVQVVRRVSNFALARPAREMLYTHLSREDRYKAKNFIDTVVYRSGDQIGSWGYAGLQTLQLGLTQIAWLAVPMCLVWAGLGVYLGRQNSNYPSE